MTKGNMPLKLWLAVVVNYVEYYAKSETKHGSYLKSRLVDEVNIPTVCDGMLNIYLQCIVQCQLHAEISRLVDVLSHGTEMRALLSDWNC